MTSQNSSQKSQTVITQHTYTSEMQNQAEEADLKNKKTNKQQQQNLGKNAFNKVSNYKANLNKSCRNFENKEDAQGRDTGISLSQKG